MPLAHITAGVGTYLNTEIQLSHSSNLLVAINQMLMDDFFLYMMKKYSKTTLQIRTVRKEMFDILGNTLIRFLSKS